MAKKSIESRMIAGLVPSSKMSLKLQCLMLKDGDEEAADKLYSYLIKGINLPDTDPVQPTLMQQVKDGADGVVDWIKNNAAELTYGYNFIREIIVNKGALPVAEVADEIEELPPINE